MTVEDVLARRTRILFLDAKLAMDVAPAVAEKMADALEKDEEWIRKSGSRFTQLAHAIQCC